MILCEKLDAILSDIRTEDCGCRLYTRSLTWDGYGRYDGRNFFRVHVYVLEKKLGRELSPEMQALHTCDVRNCVAENHLYEGTRSQNMHDMYARGRRVFSRETHVTAAKISDNHVIAIRRLHARGFTQRQIGAVFAIRERTVSDIVRRVTWKNVL